MTATIAQMRHFIALADSGSFTKAADSTRRSQAAFSRSIAVLESGLGVALVERNGHRNALTPIGRMVLAHARQVVAQADELQQVVRHHVSGEAGHIRMGLSATPSTLLGAPLLRMAAQHPGGMHIQLVRGPHAQQIDALRNRALDALVTDLRALPDAHPDLEVHRLAALPTGVLVRAGHPLTHGTGLSIDDFLHFPVACTGMSAVVGRQLVQRFGPQAHPDALITLASEVAEDLLVTARDTDAVYIGILATAEPLLKRGELVRLPFPTEGLESHIAWVQRVAKAPNPVLDGIRECVRDWLRAVVVSGPKPETA